MASYRAARISQEIQHFVTLLFEREVSDPRLASANVTRVEVTGDLRAAKIFIAPLGDAAETAAMMEALQRATSYFRRSIAASLDLRFAPEVRFVLDPAVEKGERFLRALEAVRSEAQQRAQTEKGPQHADE